MTRTDWNDYDWQLIHEAPQRPALHMALDAVITDEVGAGTPAALSPFPAGAPTETSIVVNHTVNAGGAITVESSTYAGSTNLRAMELAARDALNP